MAFADTSSAKIALVKESTYGTNPGSGFTYVRFTSDSLVHDTESAVSEEVTGDRNPQELVRTNISASGDINFEFSANNFDTLLEGALTNTWSTTIAFDEVDVNIENVSSGTFDLDEPANNGVFTNASVGQWLQLSGFTTNGTIYGRITVKNSNSNVTVEGVRSDGAAVTNESGQTVYIRGSQLKLGTTKTTFSIERQWDDINVFELFTGMAVSTASLTIAPGSIITGAFSFLGAKQDDFATTQAGTPTAAGTERIVNAVDHVAGIMEGGFTSESALCFTEISFSIDNQLRAQNCIGTLGAVGIGLGVAQITGTLTAFLEDKNLIEKYLDFTETKLAFRIQDTLAGSDRNIYIFTFPSVKFQTGQDVISGNAADGLVELEWTAQVESGGSASAITIDRMPQVAS